jgi:hypothetical protein
MGMAIYRLLNHVQPPELKENGHTVECKCNSCRILTASTRYADSEFSGLFNRQKDNDDENEEP